MGEIVKREQTAASEVYHCEVVVNRRPIGNVRERDGAIYGSLIDLIASIGGRNSQSNQVRGYTDEYGNPIEEWLYMALAYDQKYGTAQHLVYVLKRLRPGVRGFAIDAGSAYGAITKEEITSPLEMVYTSSYAYSNWKDAFGKRIDIPVNVEQFVRLAKFAGFEAELVVNRYYGGGAGSGETGSYGHKMSNDGKSLLRYHELGPSDQKKFAAKNADGEILKDSNGDYLGFYPYYVFRFSNTAQNWESDGGITIGFGHYISETEVTKGLAGFDQREYDLLYTYVNQ